MRYHLIPIRTGYYLKDNKTKKISLGENVGRLEPLYTADGNATSTAAGENRMAIHQKIKDRITFMI